jgi:hypothetical protein
MSELSEELDELEELNLGLAGFEFIAVRAYLSNLVDFGPMRAICGK